MAARRTIALPLSEVPPAGGPRRVGRALRGLVLAAALCLMALAAFLVFVLAGLESGPAALGLAVLLAVAPVPVYAWLVLWVDRFEPEPLRAVAFTFAYGATVACLVALVVNSVGQAIVGSELGTDAAEIYGGSISAPVVEEAAKASVLVGLVWWRREEVGGVLDGIVYAAMVGLGFAMTENVFYYARGAMEDGVPGAVGTFVVRGILSPFAHPTFTALTGIGIGLAAASGRGSVRLTAPLLGLLGAILLHSAWNTAAAAGAFAGVYLLIMVPVFLGLVALVLGARAREGAVIRRELSEVLPEAEAQALGSLRERRRQRRVAARAGGRRAKQAAMTYQRAATDLAFLRRAQRRGAAGRDAPQREAALLEQLRAARVAALRA